MTQPLDIQLQIGELAADSYSCEGLEGSEHLNGLYHFAIETTSQQSPSELSAVPGDAVLMRWSVSGRQRCVHGVVSSIASSGQVAGSDGPRWRYRVDMVPRAWLATCGSSSRVFEQRRVDDIISAVLAIYAIPTEWALDGDLPVRAHTTQYQESDWDFVCRLAGEHGLSMRFEQPVVAGASLTPHRRAVLVFTDNPQAYGRDSDTTLSFRPHGHALSDDHEHALSTFALQHSVTTSRAVFRQFDPRRPASALMVDTESPNFSDHIGRALGGAALETFQRVTASASDVVEHVDRPLEHFAHQQRHAEPSWRWDAQEPARMMRRLARDGRVAEADGSCPWLTAGQRFTLVDHPDDAMNQEWTPVRVQHLLRQAGDDGARTYQNHVSCVPADVLYPAVPPQRPAVHAVQTAVVVGAGEITTNDLAQVKVRFHWERSDHDTCWLRVMQPWAGAGFGAQFIPRVGTEVVVAFEGGNPDAPIVLGGVYNGMNPPPFRLPEERTRSGFRSRTTPSSDNGSHNELSFDDAQGEEQVRLRAQRDLEIDVQQHRAMRVGGDSRVRIEGERHLQVQSDSHETHAKQLRVTVGANEHRQVRGERRAVVGSHALLVEGDSEVVVAGVARDERLGPSKLVAHDNVTQQIAGNYTLAVGNPDGARSAAINVEGDFRTSAREVIELRADSGLVLRCGDSVIRMDPDQIVIDSPTVVVRGADARMRAARGKLEMTAETMVQAIAPRIMLEGDGSNVALTSEVQIDGSQILLNSPADADDPLETDDDEPTIIELVDQTGQPIAHQPYRIIMADGGERSGALDANGRAEIDLDRGADIIFPGLRDLTRN